MKSFDLSSYGNLLDIPQRIVDPFSWTSHIPFSFFLIEILKPQLFVELGVHTGNSYNAFCQAVQTLKTDTKCYGVDTWQGDKHAGYYDESVYKSLFDYQQKYYKDFSVLIKSTFDEALENFSDSSIDLLHIDGLHTYEGVKHDFNKWLPKMSERGVVLLHDTNVRGGDFGVWKFWEEIRERYTSIEFKHGNGLGVAMVGQKADLNLKGFVESYKENPFYGTLFSRVGEYVKTFSELEIRVLEVETLNERLDKTQKELSKRAEIIQGQDATITGYHDKLVEKEKSLQDYNEKLIDKINSLQKYNDRLIEKDSLIQEIKHKLIEKETRIREHEKSLRTKTIVLEKSYDRIKVLAEEIDRRGKALKDLGSRNKIAVSELSAIKSSRSWRVIEKYRDIRIKLSQIASKPVIYCETAIYAFRILKNDGVRFFWSKVRDRARLKRSMMSNPPLANVPEDLMLEQPLSEASESEINSLNCTVSVFIPTKNAGPEFDELLSRLNRQKGIEDLEIIVADSGSEDATKSIAASYKAEVICIDPSSFNHGETRNLGVDKSKGDYVLYITQDVIPIGDEFLYQMARVLEDNPDVAAVTCKQIPRSDSDMFFAWSMEKHYLTLNLLRDKIMGADNPGNLLPMQKRSISSLDNVCTLYRKIILERYRFNKLQFAEDLDLGIRLIEDGHRIAFLASSAVIHSHNRPPFYSLKRSYMDTICQNDIMENGCIAIHYDLNDAIDDIVLMFEKINYMLSKRDGTVPLKRIADFFRKNGRLETPLTNDSEFTNFMFQLKTYRSSSKKQNKKIFFDNFGKRLDEFFSSITEKSIVIDEFNIDDFNESVYKIYAGVIGSQLSVHCAQGFDSSIISKEINKALTKDV